MRQNKEGAPKRKIILTASEIGQYHYCPLSWYLQKKGFTPASHLLQRGKESHENIGKILTDTIRSEQYIKWIFRATLLFLTIAVLFYFLEVI